MLPHFRNCTLYCISSNSLNISVIIPAALFLSESRHRMPTWKWNPSCWWSSSLAIRIDVHFRALVIRSRILFLLRVVLSAREKVINKYVRKVEWVNLSSWGILDWEKMIPSRQLNSVKPVRVVKNYRELWLVVDQQINGGVGRTFFVFSYEISRYFYSAWKGLKRSLKPIRALHHVRQFLKKNWEWLTSRHTCYMFMPKKAIFSILN